MDWWGKVLTTAWATQKTTPSTNQRNRIQSRFKERFAANPKFLSVPGTAESRTDPCRNRNTERQTDGQTSIHNICPSIGFPRIVDGIRSPRIAQDFGKKCANSRGPARAVFRTRKGSFWSFQGPPFISRIRPAELALNESCFRTKPQYRCIRWTEMRCSLKWTAPFVRPLSLSLFHTYLSSVPFSTLVYDCLQNEWLNSLPFKLVLEYMEAHRICKNLRPM